MTQMRDATNTLRTIAGFKMRDAASVLRTVAAVKMRDSANVLRTVSGATGFTATASPTSVSGFGYSHAPIQITTGYATANVSGGTASAYLWSASGSFTPINPTAQSTAFRSGSISAGNDDSGTASCTVTPTGGGSPVVTNDVDLYVQNTGS